MPPIDTTGEFLLPLVTGWLEKIQLAKVHREQFDAVGDQCMTFFGKKGSQFWGKKFQQEFMGTDLNPRFQLSIQKAFEVVAIYGPSLFHRNPVRAVRPHKRIEFGPEMFGDPNDPNVQQMHQQLVSQDRMEAARNKTACELMEQYLSYTPREQPGGGLEQAGEDAITECLITGLAVLWPEPYTLPGSNRILTGCFYDTHRNMGIDPDATSMTFGDARWVFREYTRPHWEVEREYELPKDSLREVSRHESAEAQGGRRADPNGMGERAKGKTFDLVTYYKVWSIGGVGTRLTGTPSDLSRQLDQAVGDMAHIVVCPGVPYPLNCPSEKLRRGATTDEVKRKFRWPVPYWLDRRWPFVPLYFYKEPNRIYPTSVLEPGLGELALMNILISAVANRAWESCRDILGVFDAVGDEVEKVLKEPTHQAVIRLKNATGAKSVSDLVSFLDRPSLNYEVFQMIQILSSNFDKRVGLTDLAYGLNPGGVASRSATDAKAKDEKLSQRPRHMLAKVTRWMSQAAILEKQCAFFQGVSGSDVRPLLGSVGAALWDQLITQADPETVLREMDCTVEAESTRAPNRERDAANLAQITPQLLPELSKHADITGDTGPLNRLLDAYGKAIQQDLKPIAMGQRVPAPPPPEVQQQQQQEQQQAMQAQQMEQQQEMQVEQVKQQMEQQSHQQGLVQDQQSHQQDLVQDQQSHDQEMRQSEEEGQQKLFAMAEQARAKDRLARVQAARQTKEST